jgi:hypothetical protein
MMKNSTTVNRWNNLDQVFGVLNDTVHYVVLRKSDSSIDILTDNRAKLIHTLKPKKFGMFFFHKKVKLKIGGRQVDWNIRGIGDNYYCLRWEQDMLQDRVLGQENFYTLNEEHYFYSFIYFALIHKKYITKEYYTKAEHLLEYLAEVEKTSDKELFPDAFDYYFDLLNDYMKRKNYVFCCRTLDEQIVASMPLIASQLEKRYGLSHVKPIRVSSPIKKKGHRVPLGNCLTFYQALLNGRKIFIKCGGFVGTHEPEFRFCDRLYKINSNNFPEVFFYSSEKFRCCVAYEFLEGETLETKIKSADFSPSERESIIIQLKDIAKSLVESGIVHRDIQPWNFLVTKEGKLKLIDFEWAVDSRKYKENLAVKNNPWSFPTFFEKHGCDAVFPLLDILEAVGSHDNYQETYRDVELFLREHSERVIIKYKYQHLYFLRLMANIIKGVLKRIC